MMPLPIEAECLAAGAGAVDEAVDEVVMAINADVAGRRMGADGGRGPGAAVHGQGGGSHPGTAPKQTLCVPGSIRTIAPQSLTGEPLTVMVLTTAGDVVMIPLDGSVTLDEAEMRLIDAAPSWSRKLKPFNFLIGSLSMKKLRINEVKSPAVICP